MSLCGELEKFLERWRRGSPALPGIGPEVAARASLPEAVAGASRFKEVESNGGIYYCHG